MQISNRSFFKRNIKSVYKAEKIISKIIIDKRPKVAYVGGWLNNNNLGDEALFDAYKHLFPNSDFIHFDGGKMFSFLTHYRRLFTSGILAGGTLIAQGGQYLEIAKSFLDLKYNLFIFGTGVATSSFWPEEPDIQQWGPILKECGFIGVRGPLSAEKLFNMGIQEVKIVGDPVIAFALYKINNSPVPRTLGINIGIANGRFWGSEEYILNEISMLAKIAKQAGWIIKWFVVWPKDLEITQKAASLSNSAEEIHIIYNDYKKYIKLVRPLTAFVGMKLHATILATCALTPSIMLEYRPKCRDYMKSINQENLSFRCDKFKAKEIWEIVCSWDSYHQRAAKMLLNGIIPLKKKQAELANKLAFKLNPDADP